MEKFRYDVDPFLKKKVNFSELVHKTIIPMNIVERKSSILDKPCFNIVEKIDVTLPLQVDITPCKEIEEPNSSNIVEKKAHRMLRIRRKKMKKHQRRKLRKRMKFVFAKIRRKREAKKEAIFRNEIISKLKEAKKFDAEEYVASKLNLYRLEILPNRIPGGVRMPEWVVREVREKKRVKYQKTLDAKERRKKLIAERGSIEVSPDHRFD